MDEITVPLYYVLNKSLPQDQAAAVLRVLSITPIFGAVISDPLDCSLALCLTNEVIRAKTDQDAHAIAKKISSDTNRPMLVLGDANFLDAVYPDGRREKVAHEA